jgi:hypothetical protein
MIRRLLVAGALVVVLALGKPALVSAQEASSTTIAELPEPHIIPRPNSGSEPEDAGDRGGALQLTVLVVVVAGLAGGVAVVVRQSRRARADD